MDIIADILYAAVNDVRKTHIMYRCNLSFRQLEAYLDLLLDRGLLSAVSGEVQSNNMRLFKITDKGQALLQAYQSLKALLTT